MNFLKNKSKKISGLFVKGKPLGRLWPLFEAVDTFLLTPGATTRAAPYIRDAIDLKRVMFLVLIALMPCLFAGIFNAGYQIQAFNGHSYSFWGCFALGFTKIFPIILVSYLVGGAWEVLFAIIRKHEISEGFLVTGMLFALILPAGIPLWQVAVGVSFGVVIGKEVFGGTGRNIFNPALVGRAFIFFSYPAQFSGNNVFAAVDGFTRATPLAIVAGAEKGSSAVNALAGAGYSFGDMFFGFIPGAIGETSALACILGLAFLLVTGIASWRIVAGCVSGLILMSLAFIFSYSEGTPAFFSLPPHWHMVMGSFAFGAVFMATDPVSGCATNRGRWIYGFVIGALIVLIRILNPAFNEGTMLAILFMNIFAPLIDHFVIRGNIKRRLSRAKG